MNGHTAQRTATPLGWWLFGIGFAIAGTALLLAYVLHIPEASSLFRALLHGGYLGGLLMLVGWGMVFLKSMEQRASSGGRRSSDDE